MNNLNKFLLIFGLHIRYKRIWITKRLEKIIWLNFIFIAFLKFIRSI